jgi:hypothetical protein
MSTDNLYFYLPGCPACEAKDKEITQPHKYLKIDLSGKNNDSMSQKVHYYFGTTIMRISRAPTILSKFYM